jgi:hypothetical protein
MIKTLYIDLKARIEAKMPEIKHVALWNRQTDREESEQPYERPAVFIEINDIVYQDYTRQAQKITAKVTSRLVVEEYGDEALEVLDMRQDLAKILHGYAPGVSSTTNSKFGPLSRVADRVDHEHDNLIIFETDYTATGQDNELQATMKTTTATLELNITQDIDNNTIQTGDGQE